MTMSAANLSQANAADNLDLVELQLRLKMDPIRNMVLWPTQKRCDESKARYRWIGGANRKGKSAFLGWLLASCARRLHPTRSVSKPVTFLVLAPSREQLQDPWEKKLLKDCELPGFEGQPFIPKWEVRRSWYTTGAGAPTIRQIDLKHGNTIRFGISKDVDAWKRRAGQAIFAIILDEAEGDENLINELYPRLLDANKDPTIIAEAGGGWILWGATPTTQNKALAKFIETCDSQTADTVDWEAFRFGVDEGSAIDLSERERLKAAFSDEDYELRMRGTTSFTDRLLIYGKQWSEVRHMRAEDYIVQDSDNIWCVYDPGGAGKESHDSGISFFALNRAEPRKLRWVKAILLNRTTFAYDVQVIAHYLRGRTLEGFIQDPNSNKADKGTGRRMWDQVRDEFRRLKITVNRMHVWVNSRHDMGIKLVQSYLEQGLVEINPSKESGGQQARWQMVTYKSYEPGMYQGSHGVVKTQDELPDTFRYCVVAKPFWVNRPCGKTLWVNDGPPPKPAPIVLTQEQANMQEQLERSARLAAFSIKRRIRN